MLYIYCLRTIDGGGGLQYHEDNTLSAYVTSYTAALREIVKAYPIVQEMIEMIETEIRGQEWDNERHRRPDKLIQYFNSINTLTQLCEPPRKVRLEALAIWFEARRVTEEFAIAPASVPLVLPPVTIKSPVIELPVVAFRLRMTPFTKALPT